MMNQDQMKENQMKEERMNKERINKERMSSDQAKGGKAGNAVPLISTVLLLLPWTILPLRTFPWALETPAAQIIILCYDALMIFTGVFTVRCYRSGRHKGLWMQLCTVVGVIYAAAAVFLLGLMVFSLF